MQILLSQTNHLYKEYLVLFLKQKLIQLQKIQIELKKLLYRFAYVLLYIKYKIYQNTELQKENAQDSTSQSLPKCQKRSIQSQCRFVLKKDCYIILTLGSHYYKTPTKYNEPIPQWEQQYQFNPSGNNILKVAIYDQDQLSDDFIGQGYLDLNLYFANKQAGNQMIKIRNKKQPAGKIELQIRPNFIQKNQFKLLKASYNSNQKVSTIKFYDPSKHYRYVSDPQQNFPFESNNKYKNTNFQLQQNLENPAKAYQKFIPSQKNKIQNERSAKLLQNNHNDYKIMILPNIYGEGPFIPNNVSYSSNKPPYSSNINTNQKLRTNFIQSDNKLIPNLQDSKVRYHNSPNQYFISTQKINNNRNILPMPQSYLKNQIYEHRPIITNKSNITWNHISNPPNNIFNSPNSITNPPKIPVYIMQNSPKQYQPQYRFF